MDAANVAILVEYTYIASLYQTKIVVNAAGLACLRSPYVFYFVVLGQEQMNNLFTVNESAGGYVEQFIPALWKSDYMAYVLHYLSFIAPDPARNTIVEEMAADVPVVYLLTLLDPALWTREGLEPDMAWIAEYGFH